MKKKTAAVIGVSAAVLSVSAGVNDGFEVQELVQSATQLEQSGDYDYSITYTEDGELSRADSLRARIIRWPVAIKALILLPLWALGAIPMALVSALAGTGVWGILLNFVLQAGVLAGIFCLVYKLLFPNKKLKTLFKRRNLKWLLAGSGAAVGVNWVLSEIWSGWAFLRVILFLAVGFGILCLCYKRICGWFKAPKAEPVETKLEIVYD